MKVLVLVGWASPDVHAGGVRPTHRVKRVVDRFRKGSHGCHVMQLGQKAFERNDPTCSLESRGMQCNRPPINRAPRLRCGQRAWNDGATSYTEIGMLSSRAFSCKDRNCE